MRSPWFRSGLPSLRAALAGLLVLALFGLGPGQFAPSADEDGVAALLAAGAICSSVAGHDDGGGQKQAPVGHVHAQCVLCQTGMTPFILAGAAVLPGRVAVRAPMAMAGVRGPDAPAFPFAYASRAPPVIASRAAGGL